MDAKKPDHISQKDWDEADIPELTDANFANARPFAEVFPEQFASWKRGKGRPKVESPKQPLNLRLAADVVRAVKATGKGYNARVERLIREAMAAGKL